ncbi:Sporulation protein YtfJ (Spore_YtfJ) [uncultured archaeon]|nr:Sporulation protein YtfJ (Spore_YtfJ) [uncultured archaeon]
MAAEDAIKATVEELVKALSARNIIGEPIEMDDKIIIPITKMGMGFGTGVGHGSDDASKGGVSGGAGGGVGVFPVAVVIVFKGVAGSDGVKVVPLTAPSPLAEPVSNIAHMLMERLLSHKESSEKKSGDLARIEVE